jgi:hypothetical protein
MPLLMYARYIPRISQLLLTQPRLHEELNSLGTLNLAALSAQIVELCEVLCFMRWSLCNRIEQGLVLLHL